MFVTGLLLFSAASLVGGLATSQAWLLAARAVQGAGGAIVAPTALALIATTFPQGPARNRAMGVYSGMSAAGGAVGLLAGGLLVTYVSWRWVLFVNVPIGIGAALAAMVVLPGTAGRIRVPGRFDLAGAITGTVRDSSGAVVAGAKITVDNESRAISRSVMTDDRGEFRASEPLPVQIPFQFLALTDS